MILSIINEHVRGSQDLSTIKQTETVTKTEVITDDDPLVTLKKRLAKGEISKEEFEKLKQEFE